MWWKCILVAAAAALFNNAAVAAAPKLSGNYLITLTILCQGGLKVNKDGQGDVKALSSLYSARLESNIGVISFNHATKTASGGGFSVFGETLQVQGSSGPRTNMHEVGASLDFSYSNTATTLTLLGEVYRVFYGKLVNGIAQAAVFQRLGAESPNQHCAMQGQLIRK